MSVAVTRLMTWLSPAFPVGGFAYSHGLERAVHDGLVRDAETLRCWLESLILFGSAWNDAALLAESWRRARDEGDLEELAQLGEALAGSAERHMETMLQGRAFLDAASHWPTPVFARLPADCPYPVAVGAAAGAHGVGCEAAAAAWFTAFASNIAQAAIRLGVVGQGGAVATLAALESSCVTAGSRAAGSTLDDLGQATMLSEIMAMKHETLETRLFRS